MNIPANIIDNSTYKLDVQLTWLPYTPGQWQLVILRWIPEHGWTETEYYLSDEELKAFQKALNN